MKKAPQYNIDDVIAALVITLKDMPGWEISSVSDPLSFIEPLVPHIEAEYLPYNLKFIIKDKFVVFGETPIFGKVADIIALTMHEIAVRQLMQQVSARLKNAAPKKAKAAKETNGSENIVKFKPKRTDK